MSDYPEEFRALDEAVSQHANILRQVDSYIRKAIGVGYDTPIDYDEVLLAAEGSYITSDGRKKRAYRFSTRISVEEED